MITTTRKAARTHRRGAAYVFFVSVAILVSIVGISAITVSRVNFLAAESLSDRGEARLGAQSAVQAALLAIYTDSNWRSTFAHDTWTTKKQLKSGTFSFKLVDEENGDLLTDRSAPVRIYGRGTVGASVWCYSVLVQPPLETAPSNVLTNGDLETGLVTPWWETGDCRLKLDSDIEHGGVNCLLIWQRGSVTAAARQTIATTIKSGASCHVEAWVRVRTSPETIKVGAWVQSGAGWEYFPVGELAATTSWQAMSGTFTPTWTGALLDAYLEIAGTTSYQEIAVDDVSLLPAPGAAGPIPGTARRETQ